MEMVMSNVKQSQMDQDDETIAANLTVFLLGMPGSVGN